MQLSSRIEEIYSNRVSWELTGQHTGVGLMQWQDAATNLSAVARVFIPDKHNTAHNTNDER